MAELPEITKLSTQMHDTLQGKTIKEILLLQEKCANIPEADFQQRTAGATIQKVYHKGKWIITALDNGEHILLSLGMGADILYFTDPDTLPEKYQIKVQFTDNTGYTARFWWFGKFLLVSPLELPNDPNTKDIAIDPFDERFTPQYFASLLAGKKTQIKAFLMNQKNVGGIGNMYMHDILFKAGLHPQKKISDMSGDDISRLYDSIQSVLGTSRAKGSFEYEKDFFGQGGQFSVADLIIGYKENQPCPTCGNEITQIKTGSTSTFICSTCQVL